MAVRSARSLAGDTATVMLCSVGEDMGLELLAAAGVDAPSVHAGVTA